ncbi:mitochondrial fission factor-like [Chanos chanos]|uniref:Mitochondrial fission factor n=1 Tax=Chanos chanos TaxID=29144 RepID=A0A6J2WXZ1_CHACN|nr:mitochondrial fission factor-like [Chanos chanos]
MASPIFLPDGPPMPGRDPNFTEAISQRMRVPDRLRVGPGPLSNEEREMPEEPPPAYSMHIPDRLALTDAPDLSPRPLFSKFGLAGPGPSTWDSQARAYDRDSYAREPGQNALRRSFSDQSFGRTPPGTPTHSKKALHSPSSLSRNAGRSLTPDPPQATPLGLPAIPPTLLSPRSVFQAAKELGLQASQRLLQTVTQKYSSASRFGQAERSATKATVEAQAHASADQSRKSALQESWLSPEDDSGAAVELIVLRRQLVKMSRRLAGLERQNAERRQTEVVLFSLLISACLLNGWLWIRR